MRKRPLFALGMWAAALLGLVSLALSGQVLGVAQRPQPHASGQQSTKSSGQPAPTRQNPQTAQQSATKQSQSASQTAKQTSVQNAGQNAAAQTAPKQSAGQKLAKLAPGQTVK